MYLLLGASEDIETQKSGFVLLVWPGMCKSVTPSNAGIFGSFPSQKTMTDLQKGIPLRTVCGHFANARSPLLRIARVLLVTSMINRNRLRFNIITGEFKVDSQIGFWIFAW